MDSSDPTVLWRMSRGKSTAHATVFPGEGRTTVTWFFDGQMDRAENYETMELALARAEHIHGILLRDGWTDVRVGRCEGRGQSPPARRLLRRRSNCV